MEKRKEFTNTEQARLQRILQIQELSKEGYSSCEIARRMDMDRRTVTKYRTGDASLLCRSYTRSCLHSHKDFILKCLQNGLTQAEIIRRLKKLGYQKTNARNYMNGLCEEYGINSQKYTSLPTVSIKEDRIKVDYITRKSIFEFLWMNGTLSVNQHQILWEKYKLLPELETCIREFRAIFF